MQKFVIRVFTCQNMAIFRNPSKFLNFFEFSKKIWSRFFQECSRSPKKQFLQKSHYKCDLEKLLKMTKSFVEFFHFGPNFRYDRVLLYFIILPLHPTTGTYSQVCAGPPKACSCLGPPARARPSSASASPASPGPPSSASPPPALPLNGWAFFVSQYWFSL